MQGSIWAVAHVVLHRVLYGLFQILLFLLLT